MRKPGVEMATVECFWEEFKRMAREFHEAAPTLDQDELDNAWKCLGLAYLGLSEAMWQSSAAVLLDIVARAYLARATELCTMRSPKNKD